jgi:hypothetical protein
MGDFLSDITQVTSTVLVVEPAVVMWVLAVAGILAVRAARN